MNRRQWRSKLSWWMKINHSAHRFNHVRQICWFSQAKQSVWHHIWSESTCIRRGHWRFQVVLSVARWRIRQNITYEKHLHLLIQTFLSEVRNTFNKSECISKNSRKVTDKYKTHVGQLPQKTHQKDCESAGPKTAKISFHKMCRRTKLEKH